MLPRVGLSSAFSDRDNRIAEKNIFPAPGGKLKAGSFTSIYRSVDYKQIKMEKIKEKYS